MRWVHCLHFPRRAFERSAISSMDYWSTWGHPNSELTHLLPTPPDPIRLRQVRLGCWHGNRTCLLRAYAEACQFAVAGLPTSERRAAVTDDLPGLARRGPPKARQHRADPCPTNDRLCAQFQADPIAWAFRRGHHLFCVDAEAVSKNRPIQIRAFHSYRQH